MRKQRWALGVVDRGALISLHSCVHQLRESLKKKNSNRKGLWLEVKREDNLTQPRACSKDRQEIATQPRVLCCTPSVPSLPSPFPPRSCNFSPSCTVRELLGGGERHPQALHHPSFSSMKQENRVSMAKFPNYLHSSSQMPG